jgi:TolA-binding protein
MMKNLATLLLFLMALSFASAQTTIYHTDEDAVYRQALDQYQKEKYNTAQKLFQEAYEVYPNESELKSLSQFYIAQCAVNLFNADAEFLTFQYINDNPHAARVNDAWFSLGGYFYTIKKWRECIDTYKKVDLTKLSAEQQAELHFKNGYSQFSNKDFEAARISFYEIKDKKTKYTAPASYYYGHIHYQEENYQTALIEFLKLTNDKTFGPIVPYYIVQIYYMQKKYEEIIAFAPGIIDNVTEKRLAEVAQITAESYFKLEKYDDAIVYFQKYLEAAPSPSNEAVYQLAYAYYKTGQNDKAIPYFENISHSEGALGQNASYYLASCYINVNDKENARKAFASAMRSDYDPVIKQDAMFNYALMTFEVGGDPFNDAVIAFEQFIEAYPESKRIDEARRLLIQAYLGARNYKKALISIDKVKNKNNELKEAYQRIAYNRGIELYNIQQFFAASEMFKNAVKYTGFDNQREAKALYWLGESYYRIDKYTDAVAAYKEFKSAPVAHTVTEFKLVNYNLAYAYYKLNNYTEAATLFREFVGDSKGAVDANYVSDSYLRIADCFFMQKSYFQSIDFYQRAIDAQTTSVDYALMQKGICLGVAKKALDKISTLRELVRDYPKSVYADNAYYEIAQEYLKLQDSKQAIEALSSLYNKYPQSKFAGKALVQIALLNYNADNNEEAIKYYKLAVTNFNGTEESRNALFGLKNIYVEQGNIDAYSSFIDGLDGNVPRLSINEKDSLSYTAAEKLYMTAKCDEAKPAFKRYIQNYPNGSYLLKAKFYSGDCYYQSKNYDEALALFEYVIAQPQNMFTEQALLGISRIEYSRKNYERAITNYQKLSLVSSSDANLKEAEISIMQSYYQLKKYNEALIAANKVLAISGLSIEEKREAGFIKARSLHESGRDELALEAYRNIATEVLSYQGAEAKYRIVELLYKQGKMDEAEKEILSFSSQSTSHEYWIARSFITWADIFASRGNYFQAIETLQSLLNYYENSTDGILDMAKSKKKELEKAKIEGENRKPEESIEVNIESKNE